jgi:asparagine synthase (glutamine-hydrolysing)
MCGFAGRFHPIALPIDKFWHEKADRLLSHRGPDGSGSYSDACCELVHRRLALIDLSPTGHQPMVNEDGSVWAVFNGEIYNHRELRAELKALGHHFRGTSDTEVLVHLYEEAGTKMVERLRGMFAFAIYDQTRRQVLLARDRFGIKPLYYAQIRDQFVFASEIKAILALDGFRPQIDRQACYDYLGMSFIPEPQTGFAEIRALPAGSLLSIDARGSHPIEYHRIMATPDRTLSLTASAAQASQALLESVRAQSIADVPVAALLSGGIDSSLVVAAYCQTSEATPATFNAAFPDQAYDETPFARAVADRYQTRHRTIRLDDRRITPELVQKLLLHFDQPFADSSLLPTYFVSQAIRDAGIICALSGDGGDEAFGGYACFWRANHFARIMRAPELVQSAAVRAGTYLSRHTRDLGRQVAKAFQLSKAGREDIATLLAGLASYLSEEQKQALLVPEARASLQSGDRHFAVDLHVKGYDSRGSANLEELSQRMTETLFKVGLVSDMLRKVDMMSMLASIEIRVPLLDEEVVACGLRLAHQHKTDGKKGKLLLREIARQWLPAEVAGHRKQGFGIPLDKMATPPFHQFLHDTLLAPTAKTRALLQRHLTESWLKKFRQAQAGEAAGEISREGIYQRIVILLSLELWMNEYNLNW